MVQCANAGNQCCALYQQQMISSRLQKKDGASSALLETIAAPMGRRQIKSYVYARCMGAGRMPFRIVSVIVIAAVS